MRIAIDCRMIGSGGIGSYSSALLPFFIQKHECTLLGRAEQLEPFRDSSAALVECTVPPFSIKELLCFPADIAKKINACDVFYSPYCNVPSGIRVPVFTTIHDVVFLDVKALASPLGTFIRKVFYMRAVQKSAAVFTVSEFSAERIRHHLKCRKPLVVTYNAVPAWFCEEDSSASDNTAMSEDAFSDASDSVLFVGNIKKHKGLSVLVDAFVAARERGLPLKLLLVGNKDNFRTGDTEVFEKIERAPAGSVRFTGKISDSQLKTLYKTARFLVQPSFYEGFGMPPLEAMSLGCPVIMSDIPVFKEIYRDFPVTFFACGDADDLAKKMLAKAFEERKTISLPNIYSFERTFSLIEKTLCARQ